MRKSWFKVTGLIAVIAVISLLSYQLLAQSDAEDASQPTGQPETAVGAGEGESAAEGPPPGGGMGPPPARVRIGTVRLEQVQKKRLVTGHIDPVRYAAISVEESGLVIQPPPDRGSVVAEGDILARLDTSLLEADRATMLAELGEVRAIQEQRRAEMNLAESRLERLKALLPTRAVSEIEVDEARRDVAVAAAGINSAEASIKRVEAQLQRLDLRISKMVIRSRFAGQVLEKRTEIGEWVNTGGVVAEVTSRDQMDAILDIPEAFINLLPRNQPIEIRVPAVKRTLSGRIDRIVPRADTRSRTIPVIIRIDNPDFLLTPGMTVEAEVPIGEQETTTTIPRNALTTTPSGTLVYVNRGGVAVPVSVHVRYGVGDRFVVAGDLAPDEQVIVEGNVRINPGRPLIILPD